LTGWVVNSDVPCAPDRKAEAAARADALAAAGDCEGAAVWRRITDAVAQLENETPSGPVH
jgi:hypothetical protein